jgi:hypothetical protein
MYIGPAIDSITDSITTLQQRRFFVYEFSLFILGLPWSSDLVHLNPGGKRFLTDRRSTSPG